MTILGIIARMPLTKIPENSLKYIVGIMLVTFGTFWAGEGLGIEWPLSDLFLLILIAFYFILSIIIVWWLKNYGLEQKESPDGENVRHNFVIRLLKEIFDFSCGDWFVFCGVAITIVLIELIKHFVYMQLTISIIGFIYIFGISLSLITSLKKEITFKNNVSE